jgi:hypothetical protein
VKVHHQLVTLVHLTAVRRAQAKAVEHVVQEDLVAVHALAVETNSNSYKNKKTAQ